MKTKLLAKSIFRIINICASFFVELAYFWQIQLHCKLIFRNYFITNRIIAVEGNTKWSQKQVLQQKIEHF